tara:strand:+ start:347 stop:577 length:231 start_codon:yes stop_codon:yes gene_type:complete
MFDQSDIDRFNQQDYSMFLAYGDTFRDQETVSTGTGSDQLWEDEATRLIEATGKKVVCFRECVRNRIDHGGPTWGY